MFVHAHIVIVGRRTVLRGIKVLRRHNFRRSSGEGPPSLHREPWARDGSLPVAIAAEIRRAAEFRRDLLASEKLVARRQFLQRIARWGKTMMFAVCYGHATTYG
jgi:hypothetical protein